MKVSPDQMLVKCPQCSAWPMSLCSGRGVGAMNRITFECPQCHLHAVYSMGVAGTLIRITPHTAISG